MSAIRLGPARLADLDRSATDEWLVTDGLGGYATGTAAGLRTRRYHGLQLVADRVGPGRRLGLAALDPVLVIGGSRLRLAVHEWAGGAVDPGGHLLLAEFALEDGVPAWTWTAGGVVLRRELAMASGRAAVGVHHRLLRAPGPVRLELAALATWRDHHGLRPAGPDPAFEPTADGFVFEGAYRVAGPGFTPGGTWYRGVRYRDEAERGLPDTEDLWFAGTFSADLEPGAELGVTAWAGAGDPRPPPAPALVASARARAHRLLADAAAGDEVDRHLVLAAAQFRVAGPRVVAGYPWFGDWSRDTMTSYEGLFLETGMAGDGRALLEGAAATLSEGMLANTSDTGRLEYNTVDATLWFLHAVGRHVEVTGDDDLAAILLPTLDQVVDHHLRGTRYGIAVDPADGLLTQGAPGIALTWMDARVDGRPVTQRAGKAVEINALWVNGLATVAALHGRVGSDPGRTAQLAARARASVRDRFWDGTRCLDVVDGDPAEAARLRPNRLLAASLPRGPLPERALVEGCAPLLTPLGPRSLDPADPAYRPRHRAGSPGERDGAYHQGTVWPWMAGPLVEAALRTGAPAAGLLAGLEAHLREWGLGSISETADADPPHRSSGCPFQAWSVAEVLRARRLLGRGPRSDLPARADQA